MMPPQSSPSAFPATFQNLSLSVSIEKLMDLDYLLLAVTIIGILEHIREPKSNPKSLQQKAFDY